MSSTDQLRDFLLKKSKISPYRFVQRRGSHSDPTTPAPVRSSRNGLGHREKAWAYSRDRRCVGRGSPQRVDHSRPKRGTTGSIQYKYFGHPSRLLYEIPTMQRLRIIIGQTKVIELTNSTKSWFLSSKLAREPATLLYRDRKMSHIKVSQGLTTTF